MTSAPGHENGDTAATCDATFGAALTQPRNVPVFFAGRGEEDRHRMKIRSQWDNAFVLRCVTGKTNPLLRAGFS